MPDKPCAVVSSCNSKAEAANDQKLEVFRLCGADGGSMAQSAKLDHCLVVPSDSIHRIQETHVLIYHILWDMVHTLLADQRGGLHEVAKP